MTPRTPLSFFTNPCHMPKTCSAQVPFYALRGISLNGGKAPAYSARYSFTACFSIPRVFQYFL